MVTSKQVLRELCGAVLHRRPGAARTAAAPAADLDDLAAAVWVQAYDTAWLSRDWTALAGYLAPEVVVVLAGSSATISGRAAVLAHIRSMMRDAQVHEYNATELTGHTAGAIGIITHRWQLDWTVNHRRCEACGRDVLVLRRARAGWQLVWRAQAPRVIGADLQFLGANVKFRTLSG